MFSLRLSLGLLILGLIHDHAVSMNGLLARGFHGATDYCVFMLFVNCIYLARRILSILAHFVCFI